MVSIAQNEQHAVASEQQSPKDPTLKVLRKEGAVGSVSTDAPVRAPVIAGMTDPGLTRKTNQDQFLVARLDRSLEVLSSSIPEAQSNRFNEALQGYLMVLADGMGGHGGGELASSMAVDEIVHYSLLLMPWLHALSNGEEVQLSEGLKHALEEGQRRMRHVARRKKVDERLGTTLTMAYVTWPVLHLVHVGDSRAYLFRGGQLARMTRDHNVAQEMIDNATLSEEQARSSRFANVLTRAISGGHDEVEVDLRYEALYEGDLLLLCSDGLTGELGDEQIAGYLASVEDDRSVRPVVQELVGAAKNAGGRDNITAILARF